jgi:hypothetical protein
MLEGLARTMDAEAQIEGGSLEPRLDLSKETTSLKHSVHPVWSGTLAYRAMFPAGKLVRKVPGHRVLSTPMCVRKSSS